MSVLVFTFELEYVISKEYVLSMATVLKGQKQAITLISSRVAKIS